MHCLKLSQKTLMEVKGLRSSSNFASSIKVDVRFLHHGGEVDSVVGAVALELLVHEAGRAPTAHVSASTAHDAHHSTDDEEREQNEDDRQHRPSHTRAWGITSTVCIFVNFNKTTAFHFKG